MALFSDDIKTFDELFVSVLKNVYYAEFQVTEALPKMIDKATNPELRSGFEQHLQETRGQIDRLEQVFRQHGVEPEQATCPAIDGIIKAGNAMAGEIEDKQVLDAGLVAAAQLVEHYEIAQYGTLVAWAREMGRQDCASLLEQTLEEERATDQKLTRIAESRVNRSAQQEGINAGSSTQYA